MCHETTQPPGAGCASLPAMEGVAAGLLHAEPLPLGHQCHHAKLGHLPTSPAQFFLAQCEQGEGQTGSPGLRVQQLVEHRTGSHPWEAQAPP